MATVGSAGGVDGLTSKADEAVWAGGLAPEADEAAEEGLPFRFFGVEGGEGEVEDMLHGARTEARHGAAAEVFNKETVFKRSRSGILAGNSFCGSNSRWGAVVI